MQDAGADADEFSDGSETEPSEPGHGCSPPLTITFFRDYAANTRAEKQHCVTELADLIRSATAPAKQNLPWLKLARFGDQRSVKNSLRHDANVLAITGVEADYDGE